MIGDGLNLGHDVVSLSASNQIADSVGVIINADGQFKLNNNSERIGSLTIDDNTFLTSGSSVMLGTRSGGTLTITGLLQMGEVPSIPAPPMSGLRGGSRRRTAPATPQ